MENWGVESDTLVTALTAYAGECDRASAQVAGFTMDLAKPVEPELATAIARLTRQEE